MKTAMQELKEIIENAKKYYSEIKEVKKVEAVEDIVMVVDESLKAEKEQISEAYRNGFKDAQRPFRPMESYTTFEQYYQQTFKSDE